MTTEIKSVRPELARARPAGPPALAAAIREAAARVCIEEFGNRLRAAVLTGSMARDEATFVQEGERWRVRGDAEFLLVFHKHSTLPPMPALSAVRQGIEDTILRHGILCQASISAVHPDYLLKMQPHIFGYELRTCGRLVWGEPQILSLIPAFSPSDIPLEDAWRLLSNRMVELLEVVAQWVGKPETPERAVQYQAIKFYLDMATSFLLFRGAYAPSYRERAEKLRILADNPSTKNDCPLFPLQSFSDRVSSLTELKLQQTGEGDVSCMEGESGPSIAFWEELVASARALWRWELERLTGGQDQLSDRELLGRWMQLQPLKRRLRGWVHVLRQCGWQRSWQKWPNWMRRGWRGSPRYGVYTAASELFSRLPKLLALAGQGSETDLNSKELRSWLPALRESQEGPGANSWVRVASEIAWNYHEFLESTRS